MNSLKEILSNYLYFAIIFAIFLVTLVITLFVLSKKGSKKSVYLSGLFMNYSNAQTFALTLILLNFLLLVYTLIFKLELTMAFGLVSLLMIIISFSVLKNAKNLLINFGINIVNIALIYLANLTNTLRIEHGDFSYLILQIVLNIFAILFYIFTTCKFIKNIRGKGEYL
ncbi:MAG: hypothetical protein E7167_05850 [Firmicutes bacterium]|nr:hypothetical protein [Bacillota bacterium]